MPDSDPTSRLVNTLKQGAGLSSAVRNSETRRLTPGPPPEDDDIFSAGAAFLKRHPHAETLSQIPPLLGPYRIIRPLGTGGMARVFLAEHQHLRRQVAVKILPQSMADDPVMRERFKREARVVAALDHPNIVRAYDIAESDGFQFFVMEYVAGKDLDRLLRESGPFKPWLAVDYALKAATGLKHAHERRMIHRDVKPGNLLLDETGTIKILDLGLARFYGELDDQLTAKIDKGAVICTPDYAAPEQIIDPARVDHRADVYSLGATLYSLLTGQTPFNNTLTQFLASPQNREATPIHRLKHEFPRVLSEIIRRMMAVDPELRPPTMDEVIRLLTPWALAETYEDTLVNLESETIEQTSGTTAAVPMVTAQASATTPPPVFVLPVWRRQLAVTGVACVLGITAFLAWAVCRAPRVNGGVPEGGRTRMKYPARASVNAEAETDLVAGRAVYHFNPRMMLSSGLVKPVPGWGTIRTGAGQFPEQWSVSHAPGCNQPARAEIETGSIQNVIAVSEGTDLHTPKSLTEISKGRTYLLRCEYRFPSGGLAALRVSRVPGAADLAEIPFSEQTDSHVTQALLKPDRDEPVFLSIRHDVSAGFDTRPRGSLRICLLELLDITPEIDPEIAYQLEGPPREFLTRTRGEEAIEGSTPGTWPGPWVGWGRGLGTADFQFAPADSGEIVVIRGNGSTAEMHTPRSLVKLRTGRRYEARVTYRTDGGATGMLDIKDARNPLARHGVSLNDTRGEWLIATHPITPDRDMAVKLALRNDGTTPEKTLRIRELIIRDAGPN